MAAKQIQHLRKRPPGQDPIYIVHGRLGPVQVNDVVEVEKESGEGIRIRVDASQRGGVLIGTAEALEPESRTDIEGVARGDVVAVHTDFVWQIVRAKA